MSSYDQIDRMAALLAAKAGLVWDRLEKHPGFLRNRFRQEARTALNTMILRTAPNPS